MTSNDDSRMTTGPLSGTDQPAGEDTTMSSSNAWDDPASQVFGPDTDDAPADPGTAGTDPVAAGTDPGAETPRLSRPRGPSWGTVALGLVCLLVAGGALWVEWSEVTLDWSRSGPLAVVGVGLVLVLVGLAALVRRDDDEDPHAR